jgi:hypothetical protein
MVAELKSQASWAVLLGKRLISCVPFVHVNVNVSPIEASFACALASDVPASQSIATVALGHALMPPLNTATWLNWPAKQVKVAVWATLLHVKIKVAPSSSVVPAAFIPPVAVPPVRAAFGTLIPDPSHALGHSLPVLNSAEPNEPAEQVKVAVAPLWLQL